MFGQTFSPGDIGVVAFLVVLEALLSADNALVLAIMVRHLPRPLQRKALLYGLGGAFVFRFVAIILASYVIRLWWLQALGALYLLFLPVKHFWGHAKDRNLSAKPRGFWPTVLAVEFADIAFAIDSVLAGVAVVRGQQEKIWVVYLGAIIGVVVLRFAAGLVLKVLERYPVMDHVAYLLVLWVGVKLAFLSGHNYVRATPGTALVIPEMSPVVFWSVLLLIAVGGTIAAVKLGARAERDEAHEQEPR